MIGRIFEGETVFLVAGGPSLREAHKSGVLRRLSTERPVIAINAAGLYLPEAALLYWSDAMTWRTHADALYFHRARYKATLDHGYVSSDHLIPAVHRYRLTGVEGFDEDRDCLRSGNTSAYAAMHLAVHLGAARLVLLGYDMRHALDGATHWYRPHPYSGTHRDEKTFADLMVPSFATIAPHLAARGIEVVNGCATSLIEAWPRVPVAEALAWQ